MNSATFDKDAFDFLADGSGASLEPPKEPVGDVRPVSADADGFDAVADIQQRVDEVLASANPLLEAARPLLRMLADMPATLDTSDAVAGLRTLLVREIGLFQKVCDKADLRWKHMAVARYCLCTALDEAANRTTWGGAGVWAAQSLLITFEGEVDGGEKFFLLIGEWRPIRRNTSTSSKSCIACLASDSKGVTASCRTDAVISNRFANACGR